MLYDKVDPGYPKKIRGNWKNFKFKKVDAAMDAWFMQNPQFNAVSPNQQP